MSLPAAKVRNVLRVPASVRPKTLMIGTSGTKKRLRCWAYCYYLRDERGSHTAETTGVVAPPVMVRREG